MRNAIVSALALASVGTAGDFVWANVLHSHRMVAGLTHGALLCMTIGVMLSALSAGGVLAGAASGAVIGLAAALLFYALAPALGYGAMFLAWFTLWLLFSLAHSSLLRGERPWGEAVARGLLAGSASGLAFYLVSGMWTRWDPENINYVDHFLRWLVAFLPGFAALQARRRLLR